MALNFRARQSTLKTKDGKKLWYPSLVKDGETISTKRIAKKIAEKSSLTSGDVYNVIDCLISEMSEKLMDGHSVNLEGLGTFTAIAKAKGNGVETPEAVNASQIKTLRIQFTPTYTRTPMQGVTRAMFDGVVFQRWGGDPYAPNYAGGDNNNGNSGGGGGWEDPNA